MLNSLSSSLSTSHAPSPLLLSVDSLDLYFAEEITARRGHQLSPVTPACLQLIFLFPSSFLLRWTRCPFCLTGCLTPVSWVPPPASGTCSLSAAPLPLYQHLLKCPSLFHLLKNAPQPHLTLIYHSRSVFCFVVRRHIFFSPPSSPPTTSIGSLPQPPNLHPSTSWTLLLLRLLMNLSILQPKSYLFPQTSTL